MSLSNEKRNQEVRINIWRPDPSKDEYGHASFQTKNNYLSKWGSGKDSSNFIAAATSTGKASYMTRNKDVDEYGREPDFVVKIKVTPTELKKMEKYIEHMKNNDKTWLGTANCADATNGALKAGDIANIKLKGEKQGDFISTPLEFIQKLREKAASEPDRYKIERDKNKDLDKNPENIKGISSTEQPADPSKVASERYNQIAKSEEKQQNNKPSQSADISVG